MMKIRTILAVLCGFSFCFLTGCASIVSGNHQSLSVNTPLQKDATCSLKNDKGTWYVNRTPGSVTVQQSFKDMLIHCEKDGRPMGDTKIASKVKPLYFGNILFGGIIGLIVDGADGAGFGYPTTVSVPAQNPAK